LAARLDAEPLLNFLVAASPLLLPSQVEALEGSSEAASVPATGTRQWFSDWITPMALLGALAFCVTLADGAALNWSAVYVANTSGGTEALGAVGLGIFLGAVTLRRLIGDSLVSRFDPVSVFRTGAVVAGLGFGGALLVDTPIAGLVGLGLLGAGIANACHSPSPRGATRPARRRRPPPRASRPLVTWGPSSAPCSQEAWRVCPACPSRWDSRPCWFWRRPSGRGWSGGRDKMYTWQAIGTTAAWRLRGPWNSSATS
jgi:hypothetical protein